VSDGRESVVTERLIEARTVLSFYTFDRALDGQLPPGWASRPWPTGPSRGANVLLVLADRLLGLDGAGAPLAGQAMLKLAVLAARAEHAEHGGALVIMGGLASDAAASPGPYGVFAPARASVTRVIESLPDGTMNGRESWDFTGDTGARVAVELDFARGQPVRSAPPSAEPPPVQVRSRTTPEFHRTYRSDQGEDVIWSEPSNIDRLRSRTVTWGGDLFAALQSNAIPISITSVPWLIRTVAVP